MASSSATCFTSTTGGASSGSSSFPVLAALAVEASTVAAMLLLEAPKPKLNPPVVAAAPNPPKAGVEDEAEEEEDKPKEKGAVEGLSEPPNAPNAVADVFDVSETTGDLVANGINDPNGWDVGGTTLVETVEAVLLTTVSTFSVRHSVLYFLVISARC